MSALSGMSLRNISKFSVRFIRLLQSMEKGILGIERQKERDKVETYLKDRWSRQKD